MEMPDMESLQKSLGNRVRILGINQGESPAKVEAFVRKNGYSWTFLNDTAKKVGEQYRVSGYPTSVFIDADGRITGRRVGMMSREEMERSIRVALGSDDHAFKLKFQEITRNVKSADIRIKSVEAGANIGTLTYVLEDGESYEVFAFDRKGASDRARQIELQVPSYGLNEIPVSDLHGYLLNWNLDYQAGAWAVDKHNNRLTLVARYGVDMLDVTSFANVCSEMVKTVSGFEQMIDNLMAESQR
jgi:thiol-disulfide isomerase/thioredoxin